MPSAVSDASAHEHTHIMQKSLQFRALRARSAMMRSGETCSHWIRRRQAACVPLTTDWQVGNRGGDLRSVGRCFSRSQVVDHVYSYNCKPAASVTEERTMSCVQLPRSARAAPKIGMTSGGQRQGRITYRRIFAIPVSGYLYIVSLGHMLIATPP